MDYVRKNLKIPRVYTRQTDGNCSISAENRENTFGNLSVYTCLRDADDTLRYAVFCCRLGQQQNIVLTFS